MAFISVLSEISVSMGTGIPFTRNMNASGCIPRSATVDQIVPPQETSFLSFPNRMNDAMGRQRNYGYINLAFYYFIPGIRMRTGMKAHLLILAISAIVLVSFMAVEDSSAEANVTVTVVGSEDIAVSIDGEKVLEECYLSKNSSFDVTLSSSIYDISAVSVTFYAAEEYPDEPVQLTEIAILESYEETDMVTYTFSGTDRDVVMVLGNTFYADGSFIGAVQYDEFFDEEDNTPTVIILILLATAGIFLLLCIQDLSRVRAATKGRDMR